MRVFSHHIALHPGPPQETTSLGLRAREVQRAAVPRRFVTVSTPWGSVRVKLGVAGGAVVNAHPEFDECAALAARHGVALKAVMDAARHSYFQTTEAADEAVQ